MKRWCHQTDESAAPRMVPFLHSIPKHFKLQSESAFKILTIHPRQMSAFDYFDYNEDPGGSWLHLKAGTIEAESGLNESLNAATNALKETTNARGN